ncbi:hypothetical protein [Peribacillus sp. SCS-37]|uniref:hypothetical protein n=1 Tax=Paraperibacillus esterisolvens TaxID=3115296 RepID=UPI003906ABB6
MKKTVISSLMAVSLIVPTSAVFADEVTTPAEETTPTAPVVTAPATPTAPVADVPVAKLPKAQKEKTMADLVKKKVASKESIQKAVDAGLSYKQILSVQSITKATKKSFDEVLPVFVQNKGNVGQTVQALKLIDQKKAEAKKKAEEAKKKANLAKQQAKSKSKKGKK